MNLPTSASRPAPGYDHGRKQRYSKCKPYKRYASFLC